MTFLPILHFITSLKHQGTPILKNLQWLQYPEQDTVVATDFQASPEPAAAPS